MPGVTRKSDLDESDAFFEDPRKWMEARFGKDLNDTEVKYSHVVLYDKTAELKVMEQFFAKNNLVKCEEFFQTPITQETAKYGSKIHLFCKV